MSKNPLADLQKTIAGLKAGRDKAKAVTEGAVSGYHPLGVHEGYTTQVTDYSGEGPKGRLGRRRTYDQKPRYYTGAATELFGSMSTPDLIDVQTGLKRLGLLKKVTGTFDGATRSAAVLMLGSANASGQEWDKWLTEKIQALDDAGVNALDDQQGQALTIALSNPDVIKADVTQQSTALLGGNYAGDPQHYVDEIHAAETKSQTDAYNQQGGRAGTGGPGGTVTKAPDVPSLLIKEHPLDYGVEQLGQNAQALIGLLGQKTGDSRG